ncbi:MAG: hypothetical protein K8E66_00720 [Phycisphaerales bacterium]|nr:hypothetical protein [Phycisphaerales bacterium]
MTEQSSRSMNGDQFKKLAKIIYDRSGIHFPQTKKYIVESRLSHRLVELGLDDFDQYIAFLTIGPYQSDEFQEMFNRITINETSFFRNEPQLTVFERQVLPDLLGARRESGRLRLWSAACSTGEEPYTLAIIVHRTLGVRMKDWNIEILGTDISERALNIADTGAYSDYAMRSTPELVKHRYFKEQNGLWCIDENVRSMVNFELHNLRDREAARRHGTWDVIFCRNVMIYFDDDMKRRVVGMFGDLLADDGTLFIGHSENIRDVNDRFEELGHAQGFCYQPLSSPSTRAA